MRDHSEPSAIEDDWPQEQDDFQDPNAEDIQDHGTATCPYCGETLTLMIDYSAGAQSYVEDCHVCCHPILIDVSYAGHDRLNVQARRENE
ncbi:MAG: CPXCG motif-containing cysteine-rich protein [Candidatus Melainabacteria bacterium HGW-Melainabacteria-1]|nr:MAG: CPXCG motif-containing cysteine-rich protein [Candidatus Melainabacteria bacterium HGW-Melainabacteria-1]